MIGFEKIRTITPARIPTEWISLSYPEQVPLDGLSAIMGFDIDQVENWNDFLNASNSNVSFTHVRRGEGNTIQLAGNPLEVTNFNYNDGRELLVGVNLDILQNLTFIGLEENNIAGADFSSLPALVELRMANNNLSELPAVGGSLQILDVSNNPVAEVNVTILTHPNLEELHASYIKGKLGYTPVVKVGHSALRVLLLIDNGLHDNSFWEGSSNLRTANLGHNNFAGLTLPGTKMEQFIVNNNPNLAALDVSENTALVTILASFCALTAPVGIEDCLSNESNIGLNSNQLTEQFIMDMLIYMTDFNIVPSIFYMNGDGNANIIGNEEAMGYYASLNALNGYIRCNPNPIP